MDVNITHKVLLVSIFHIYETKGQSLELLLQAQRTATYHIARSAATTDNEARAGATERLVIALTANAFEELGLRDTAWRETTADRVIADAMVLEC